MSHEPAPAAPAPSRLLPSLLVLCLLAIFLFACLLFIPFTSDDAYITMRYARHAADGLGLVFNPGERVEGYSNPLWLGLLIVAARVGLDPVAAAKLLGILAAVVALLLALGIIVRVSGKRGGVACYLGLAPLATSAALVVYATSGLETALYACFLTGIAYCWLLDTPRSSWGMSACALGAALTRPEGALILAAVVVARFIAPAEVSRDGRDKSRHYALALAIVLFGAFLVARHAYFGDWLPNTFYAKPPGAFGDASLLSPLTYLRDYLVDDGAWLWLGLTLWTAGFLAPKAWGGLKSAQPDGGLDSPRSGWTAVIAGLLIVAVQAALVIHARGDWMALHRFLVPVTPLLVGLGWGGLIRLPAPKSLLVVLAVLIGVLNVTQLAQVHDEFRRGQYPYNVMAGQPQEMAGKWLARHFPPDTLLACKRIGGISYFSGMRMVDTLGLVDRSIAMIRHRSTQRGQQENQQIAEEVFARRPDLVLLAVMQRWDRTPLDQPAPGTPDNLRDVDEALYQGLAPHGYRFIYRLPQGGEGELAIYARPGLRVPQLTPP